MNESNDRDKRVIGLYGEMRLAMELHQRGWQVYRAYIDDKFDFVIMKSYCESCKAFKEALTRETNYKGKPRQTVTNLCATCKKDTLKMLVRFIQVKTSEGISTNAKKAEDNNILPIKLDGEVKKFSFHPKLRYHLADSRVFYAWIQVWDTETHDVNYFIFHTSQVSRFDNMDLATYQITDNQKTELPINRAGKITKKGKKYDYTAFDEFLNNFECLEEMMEGDDWK